MTACWRAGLAGQGRGRGRGRGRAQGFRARVGSGRASDTGRTEQRRNGKERLTTTTRESNCWGGGCSRCGQGGRQDGRKVEERRGAETGTHVQCWKETLQNTRSRNDFLAGWLALSLLLPFPRSLALAASDFCFLRHFVSRPFSACFCLPVFRRIGLGGVEFYLIV